MTGAAGNVEIIKPLAEDRHKLLIINKSRTTLPTGGLG